MRSTPATSAERSSHVSISLATPQRRCDGFTASSSRWASSSPYFMRPKPARSASRTAMIAFVSRWRRLLGMRSRVRLQPSPCSMKSRDISAMPSASARVAKRIEAAEGALLIAAFCDKLRGVSAPPPELAGRGCMHVRGIHLAPAAVEYTGQIYSLSLMSSQPYPRTWTEFLEQFSSEDACLVYLEGLRWPNGFVCPSCG